MQKKFEKLNEQFVKASEELKKTEEMAEQWLKNLLKKVGGSINVKEIEEETFVSLNVCYDGGHYPEMSNVHSSVYEIWLDDKDEIRLNVDEECDYKLQNARNCTGGMVAFEIAQYINDYFDWYNLEEKEG